MDQQGGDFRLVSLVPILTLSRFAHCAETTSILRNEYLVIRKRNVRVI